jgi:hypothetical protein
MGKKEKKKIGEKVIRCIRTSKDFHKGRVALRRLSVNISGESRQNEQDGTHVGERGKRVDEGIVAQVGLYMTKWWASITIWNHGSGAHAASRTTC